MGALYRRAQQTKSHEWGKNGKLIFSVSLVLCECVRYENLHVELKHTPYSKMAADLCAYKLALVASFKIKYLFEF